MVPKKIPVFILWILPLLIITILLSSSFRMWKEAQDLSYRLLKSLSSNDAQQIKTRLQLFLFERRKDLGHLASLRLKYPLSEFVERFKTDANGIVSRERYYYAISFIDSNAKILIRTGLDTVADSTVFIYRLQLSKYLEKLSADTEMILTTINTSKNNLLLVMFRPVFTGQDKKFMGAIAASLWEKNVFENIISTSIEKNNHVRVSLGDTLLYENGKNEKKPKNYFSEKAKAQTGFTAMQRFLTISVSPPQKGLLNLLIRQNNLWFFINGIASIIASWLLAMALFISQRLRLTTTELASSEQRYRHLAENASDMIFQQSIPDGKYEYVSPAAERLTGYKPAEFYNTPFLFSKILIPQQMDRYKIQWQGIIEGKAPKISEFSIIHKSGEQRWFNQRNSLIFKDGVPVAMEGILTDFTEQKKAAIEREELINELETKNRDLERFTYIISHELKTPLITIKGFLGYLEDEAAKGDISGFHQDVLRIISATENMSDLLNDLVVLNRIGRMTGEKQYVKIYEIVQKCIRQYSGRIKEKSIQVSISENLPEVKGYPGELIELYNNLLDNAVKFSENQKAAKIEIGFCKTDSQIILFVKDNGRGFESRYSERIFGLFNKLDSSTRGTGAGLALAKRIIEHHGGWIRAQSEGPGKGTMVFFSIPE